MRRGLVAPRALRIGVASHCRRRSRFPPRSPRTWDDPLRR